MSTNGLPLLGITTFNVVRILETRNLPLYVSEDRDKEVFSQRQGNLKCLKPVVVENEGEQGKYQKRVNASDK